MRGGVQGHTLVILQGSVGFFCGLPVAANGGSSGFAEVPSTVGIFPCLALSADRESIGLVGMGVDKGFGRDDRCGKPDLHIANAPAVDLTVF